MEAQKVSKELEANIQALADRKAKREEDLAKLNANIKQLKQELKIAQNDVAILYGAIQAYQGAVQIIGREPVSDSAAVVDVAVSECAATCSN